MDKLYDLYEDIIEDLIYGVFSKERKKEGQEYRRVIVEPLLLKGQEMLQFSYEYDKKVQHENLDKDQALERFKDLSYDGFRQVNLFTSQADYQVLISKKRKLSIQKSKPSREKANLSHNRQKNYILQDGHKHDFLIRLGVMNKEGKVLASRYDKFRQINRFLELVEDTVSRLDSSRTISIVDFGCGKSYLTFALYYYLVDVLKLDVRIMGLDLKEDVIDFCNQVALDLDYKGLKFYKGDIRDYKGQERVDMVVTLHACDIATDAALVKALGWEADVILSVPCCQSEFYSKLGQENLEPMLKHGIIKERLASLVTDSLRACLLEALGYNVQLVEFIDLEHTHKNILIRAYREGSGNLDKLKAYRDFKEYWQLDQLFIEQELEKIGIDLK